jgi:hypothetical protein
MQVRLPGRAHVGGFVPVRWELPLRRDVQLPERPARERAPVGESVMRLDTGLLAVVGSLCRMRALVEVFMVGGLVMS